MPLVTADVLGERLAFGVDRFECGLDLVRRRRFVDVTEHEDRRLEQRRRVRHVLTRDVGSGAVNRLEDCALCTEVRAGDEAEAADEGAA